MTVLMGHICCVSLRNYLGTPEGKVPNWFWRTMQYLILGNRWVKEKGNKNEN